MTALERCDRLGPQPLGDGHEARADATQIVVRVRLRQLGDPLPGVGIRDEHVRVDELVQRPNPRSVIQNTSSG
jgi:hypothetical protein